MEPVFNIQISIQSARFQDFSVKPPTLKCMMTLVSIRKYSAERGDGLFAHSRRTCAEGPSFTCSLQTEPRRPPAQKEVDNEPQPQLNALSIPGRIRSSRSQDWRRCFLRQPRGPGREG